MDAGGRDPLGTRCLAAAKPGRHCRQPIWAIVWQSTQLKYAAGDKPRSALEFIESVKRVRALAPTQVLTGHENICGESHINASLTRIIESVQWVHDQTVAGMNEGKTLSALMSEVRPPAELALTEEYGKVSWNVRAIWHEYTGWYDPSSGITGLYPDSTAAIEPTLIALCGGKMRWSRPRGPSVLTTNP